MAGALLESVMSHLLISPKPKFFKYKKDQIKDMLNMGKWVTGATIFNYFFENGDDMVVGKLLGANSLGIYQAAYKLSTLPITEITKVFNQVTFPIYSNISGDVRRLKKAFIKTTITVSMIVIPMGLVLYYFATEIVLIVLGPNWISVIPVLKILSVFGMVRAITFSMNPLFNSLKKQDYLSHITLFSLVAMLVTIVPFVKNYQILGAGYSVLLATTLTLPVVLRLVYVVFGRNNSKT